MREKISTSKLKQNISVANKQIEADIVFTNGYYLNVFSEEVIKADVAIKNGYIVGIGNGYKAKETVNLKGKTLCPALIDSHIHIESSQLSPLEFRNLAVPHGTCAIIADPHEIANVCGLIGISYMLNQTKYLDLKVFFMASSCVPSCEFDESKHVLGAKLMEAIYENPRVLGLAEFMNAYGIYTKDKACLEKCVSALNNDLIIDGHAPGVSEDKLQAYLNAAISTDHECESLE
ncbi:MAG: amidohydrolase family protein, partial [Coriobacteriales bacterium]|nr:amidohydrolase family protein [Coriobacteriales bacterium]